MYDWLCFPIPKCLSPKCNFTGKEWIFIQLSWWTIFIACGLLIVSLFITVNVFLSRNPIIIPYLYTGQPEEFMFCYSPFMTSRYITYLQQWTTLSFMRYRQAGPVTLSTSRPAWKAPGPTHRFVNRAVANVFKIHILTMWTTRNCNALHESESLAYGYS